MNPQKIIRFISTILITLLCSSTLFANEQSDSLNGWNRFWDYMYERFEVVPEYTLGANISSFAFYKNSSLKQKYLMENNTTLDLGLVSFKKKIYLFGLFELQTLMGRNKGENVMFDPAEMNFGIVPTFEYRRNDKLFQLGLNHHCFHEIDQFEVPTIYWNGVFLAAGSQNMRLPLFRNQLEANDSWTFTNRFSWYVNAMYYIKEFSDIVEPQNINAANERDTEFRVKLRYALHKSRFWLFLGTSETTFGSWSDELRVGDTSGGYYMQQLGLQALLHRGNKGVLFFVDYHFDTIPENTHFMRFSKDRMLEMGIEFFM